MAFIAHTQTARGGEKRKYSVYKIIFRQRKKWRQLWQIAQIESAEPTRTGSPDPIDKDRKRERKDPIEQWRISELEQACLVFCIELLNQIYYIQKYKNTLICVIAVLGRRKFG